MKLTFRKTPPSYTGSQIMEAARNGEMLFIGDDPIEFECFRSENVGPEKATVATQNDPTTEIRIPKASPNQSRIAQTLSLRSLVLIARKPVARSECELDPRDAALCLEVHQNTG